MSGLEKGDKTAVTKTSVSPHETKQEPDACSVQFVVLIIMGFSPTFISNVSFTAILFGGGKRIARIYQKVGFLQRFRIAVHFFLLPRLFFYLVISKFTILLFVPHGLT